MSLPTIQFSADYKNLQLRYGTRSWSLWRPYLPPRPTGNTISIGPATSINAAIQNAKKGDTILLMPGLWTESVWVQQNKRGITIAAVTPGTAIIQCPYDPTYLDSGVRVDADDVWVDGLVVLGPKFDDAHQIPNPLPTNPANNCGISWYSGLRGRATNNVLLGHAHCGGKTWANGLGTEWSGNVCAWNGVSQLDHGIYCAGGKLIDGNWCWDNAGYGIQVYNGSIPTDSLEQMTIRRNQTGFNQAGGIVFQYGPHDFEWNSSWANGPRDVFPYGDSPGLRTDKIQKNIGGTRAGISSDLIPQELNNLYGGLNPFPNINAGDMRTSTPLGAFAMPTPADPNVTWLSHVYADVLGRPIDPQGQSYWLQKLSAGQSRASVAMEILKAPEAVKGRQCIVRGTYLQLLKRAANNQEATYWSSFGDLDMLSLILASDEYYARP